MSSTLEIPQSSTDSELVFPEHVLEQILDNLAWDRSEILDITDISTGSMNYVLAFEREGLRMVLRTPREGRVEAGNSKSMQRSWFAEAATLERIDCAQSRFTLDRPLQHPIYVHHGSKSRGRPYIVNTFVPGVTLTETEVIGLSGDEKIRYGYKIGEFIGWMEAMTYDTTENTEVFTRELHSDYSLTDYYHSWASEVGMEFLVANGLVTAAAMMRKLQHETHEYLRDAYASQEYLAHGDLRPANTTFDHDGRWEAVGVVDFGQTRLASASQEMRCIRRLGNDVLRGAIDGYVSTGGEIDERYVLMWERIQNIVILGNRVRSIGRAGRTLVECGDLHEKLQFSFPDEDWSEVTAYFSRIRRES